MPEADLKAMVRDVNPVVIDIGSRLRTHFLEERAPNDISVFLCGGAGPNEDALRRRLGDTIASLKSKYSYAVFYPEDMFLELILGHQKQDLLSLENLLAQSVSAVTILLHSPGTFTELGAFANHRALRDKLIVVMDPRYKNKPSFINIGPIRYLNKKTSSHVLYQPMVPTNMDLLAKGISKAARDIGAKHPPHRDLANPVASYEFYLALLYVLDPMPRVAVPAVARTMETKKPDLAATAAETVSNGLINNGDALLLSGRLTVSPKGVHRLLAAYGTERRRAALRSLLSELRILALNSMLRRRFKSFWGEAA